MSTQLTKVEFQVRELESGVGILVMVERLKVSPTGEQKESSDTVFLDADIPADEVTESWVRAELKKEGML